ncbi:MAG: ATP-binding cassette domain-containing protein [Chloroflexi bacterium]|nr:ATP-binding cassette domain-containing protein [Chloroflexota bacterium]
MPEPQAIVETRNLSKSFKVVQAVDALNLTVNHGDVFGLLGPNGAGKTTTIKMMTTLLSPTSGDASVAGFSIFKQQSQVRRSIGYVPQLLSADGTLTGYENLLIFSKLYDVPGKEREQRVRGALAFMGLEEAANRMARTYSGGMIRRLEIAQSVLHRPRVLFLDEPTVGLDPLARNAVWQHIMQLRDEHDMTIILTTHLMEEADALCNRVAIMHRGKLVALDSPATLKASIGKEDASLDDVFVHFTGDKLETGATYRDTARTRRSARRLG